MSPRARQRAPRHRREPDPLALTVGVRIKALRLAADFNFDAFVEETGLGRGYVSELERGLVVPTVSSLAKVATALGLTMADLVIGETPREKLFEALRGAPDSEVERLLRLLDGLKKAQPRTNQLLRVSEASKGSAAEPKPGQKRGTKSRSGPE